MVFEEDTHPNGQRLFSARIIPFRGSWVEFTIDIHDVIYVHIDKKKKFPATVLPAKVFDRCSPETVKIGTVCMMTNPYPLEKGEIGRNDYFFATQKCADLGGYLPTAAQLIGAAKRVKLAGRVDDNEVTASTDIDPTDGLKDKREMSATLTTTASGGRAAGAMSVFPMSPAVAS